VLQGEDPVFEWVKGTSMQPILALLDDEERQAFCVDYAARLREAYPRRTFGTRYPFTRCFFVAAKPGER
jgi:trans-aconitate 2-methyltransferase